MKEWKTGEPRLTVFEASKGAKWFRLSLFGCFFFGGVLEPLSCTKSRNSHHSATTLILLQLSPYNKDTLAIFSYREFLRTTHALQTLHTASLGKNNINLKSVSNLVHDGVSPCQKRTIDTTCLDMPLRRTRE